jgi:hypothetical protein
MVGGVVVCCALLSALDVRCDGGVVRIAAVVVGASRGE